jgi:TldD protein
MDERIEEALRRSRADFTDIRIEQAWHTRISFEGPHLENLETYFEMGGIVRCLVGGGWGIAVFNTLDDLPERVADAEHIARLVSSELNERFELPPAPPIRDQVRASLQKDPRTIPLQEKLALVRRYNERMLRESPKIVSTRTAYADSFRIVTIANSEGTFIVEERPDTAMLLAALAREDTNIQQAWETVGEAAGFEIVEGQEEKAVQAARRALDLLQARPVQGGIYTVIVNPELAGVLIHEAFGHLCEADFLAKSPAMRQLLTPGRVVGPPELNVVEDGYLPGRRGNTPYDDEGTPRRRVYLIRNGVLEGFLHSRETAARMGFPPTGNARALSYQYEPIVRMRNTYIDRGQATFAEMLRGVEHGIYACGFVGGNTGLGQFTFSAAYAYEIVHGEIGEMLREVVLTGNIFETLHNVDMIGNDLTIYGGAGGCGKEEQQGLPLTLGGPHVRIQNLTVGGRTT